MDPDAFELGAKLAARRLQFYPYSAHWKRYHLGGLDLSSAKWRTFKYLNNRGNGFGKDINLLPNDQGGLYLFSVHCPLIDGLTSLPVYVGRALITEHESLRARCRSYFTTYSRNEERPRITRMFRYWGKDLHLSFICLPDNDITIELEKNLINALMLPFNGFIPDVEPRQAKIAFTL